MRKVIWLLFVMVLGLAGAMSALPVCNVSHDYATCRTCCDAAEDACVDTFCQYPNDTAACDQRCYNKTATCRAQCAAFIPKTKAAFLSGLATPGNN